MSQTMPPGLAMDLDEDRPRLVGDRRLEASARSSGSAHLHVPVEGLEGVGELVDRPAVEAARGDELVARLHQRVEDQELRGVAGGHRQRRRAALERGDPLLQHRLGRVHDAGVDVAELLQAEQRGGMVDVVEDEGRRLVDRRRARAGRRVGLRAGMDGQRVETGVSSSSISPRRSHADGGAMKDQPRRPATAPCPKPSLRKPKCRAPALRRKHAEFDAAPSRSRRTSRGYSIAGQRSTTT